MTCDDQFYLAFRLHGSCPKSYTARSRIQAIVNKAAIKLIAEKPMSGKTYNKIQTFNEAATVLSRKGSLETSGH